VAWRIAIRVATVPRIASSGLGDEASSRHESLTLAVCQNQAILPDTERELSIRQGIPDAVDRRSCL